MKKLFMALALVISTTACNKMEEFDSASNFVLTGYNESNADSRTAFGTPNESTIPFLWSSGDYIWLGATKSDAINADCQIANFTFSGGSPAYSVTGHVFYNLTGNSEYAKVLNIQTADGKKAAEYIAQEIEYETGIETRETVLGYIQRGGSPTPFDRNLATRMGGHATELIATGQFGRMVALQGDKIGSIPLEEVAGKLKSVHEDHDLIVQGKRMGICFG